MGGESEAPEVRVWAAATRAGGVQAWPSGALCGWTQGVVLTDSLPWGDADPPRSRRMSRGRRGLWPLLPDGINTRRFADGGNAQPP